MRIGTGALTTSLLFVFFFTGFNTTNMNTSYAGEMKGEIAKLKKRKSNNYNVTMKDGSTYFFRDRIAYKVIIHGKPATQADLRVGMVCKLEYLSRKRGDRLDVSLIDCVKGK